MIETIPSSVDKWKGLKTSLAPGLHEQGEFILVEGVINEDTGVVRVAGKQILYKVDKAVLSIAQFGNVLIIQTPDDLSLVSFNSIFTPSEYFVTVGGLPVTNNGSNVYAGT